MTVEGHVWEFQEHAFVVGSDPLVCVVQVAAARPFLTLAEIDAAFSGHASYRQRPWMTRYVGVWGRRNCQRLRPLLRERGAGIVLHRERPDRLRLASYTTEGTRRKARTLDQLGG